EDSRELLPLGRSERELGVVEDRAKDLGERAAVALGEANLPLGDPRVEAGLRDAGDAVALLPVEANENLGLWWREIVELGHLLAEPGDMAAGEAEDGEEGLGRLDVDRGAQLSHPPLSLFPGGACQVRRGEAAVKLAAADPRVRRPLAGEGAAGPA